MGRYKEDSITKFPVTHIRGSKKRIASIRVENAYFLTNLIFMTLYHCLNFVFSLALKKIIFKTKQTYGHNL